MRVLIATQYLQVIGGAETYLRSLLPRLKAAGADLAVAVDYSPQRREPTIIDATPELPVWRLDAPSHSLEAIRDWRPDVIYHHGLSSLETEAELIADYPTVHFAHAYSAVCISGTKLHARPRPTVCERPLGPGCFACYYPRRCGGLNPLTMWREYHLAARRLRHLHRMRHVLVASDQVRGVLVRNGLPVSQVTTAPLFPPQWSRLPEPPVPRAMSGRILFAGRLVETKGWRTLLHAIPIAQSRLGRPLSLAIAGDGPDRAAVESLGRQLALDVEYLGFLDPVAVREQMCRSDVLAFPSLWPEPFGLAGIEAGCVGLPSVGFSRGAVPEWLSPGDSGELADESQEPVEGFAMALVRCLQDDAHWHQLRLGAWRHSERFQPDRHVETVVQTLDEAARPRAETSNRAAIHA